MGQIVTSIEFIRGLRASIPDFVPGFEDGEGRLTALEIVCPEPFGNTPIELRCTYIIGQYRALQDTTYYLSSQGERLSVYRFMEMLHENFPWMKGLVIPRIRLLVGVITDRSYTTPTIELEVETTTDDGRFCLSGAYTLDEKERGPEYRFS